MARIQSLSQQFRIAVQSSLEATHKEIVATARREHARVMATEPKPTHYEQFVDGVRGAPIEAVKGNGRILFRYPRLEEVVRFAMDTLFDQSPVLSGDYRMGHRMFLNGKEVSNLAGYKPGDDVVISNHLPYSRKIEAGSMTMRVSGTDLVYQRARRKVVARFGNVAAIDFTYRGLIGQNSGSGTLVNPRKAKGRAHNKSDRRYPVLIIRER